MKKNDKTNAIYSRIAIITIIVIITICVSRHLQDFDILEFPYIEYILSILGINLTILTFLLVLKDANAILRFFWKKGKYQLFIPLIILEVIGVVILPYLFRCKIYVVVLINLSIISIIATTYSLLKMIYFEKEYAKLNEDELDIVYKKNINLIAQLLLEIRDEIRKK